jgi:predicted nuclease with TOPRIM domain
VASSLEELVERRAVLFDRRNELEAAVQRLNAEIEEFDRQIEFADAVRIADADELPADDL